MSQFPLGCRVATAAEILVMEKAGPQPSSGQTRSRIPTDHTANRAAPLRSYGPQLVRRAPSSWVHDVRHLLALPDNPSMPDLRLGQRGPPRVRVTGPASPSPRTRTGRSPASVSRRRSGAGRARCPATRAGLSREFCGRAGPGPLDVGRRGRDRGAAWGPGRGCDGKSAFEVPTLGAQHLGRFAR